MQNKQFKATIKHDLAIGFRHNAPTYILVVVIFSFFCLIFFNDLTALRSPLQPLNEGSFLDCGISVFKGMAVFVPSPLNQFKIPIVWLTIQVFVAILILTYPTQDLFSYGTQILVRTKKRSLWWLSKCIWNCLSVMAFYLIGILVIVIFTLIYGKMSLTPDLNVNLVVNQLDLKNYDLSQLLIAVFLLPVLTSIALSLFQMTISFILSPIYSFIIVICLLITSAYYCSPIFIGNYSMLLRNKIITPKGIDSSTAIIVNLAIITISIIVGYFYFKKYDILNKS